MVERLHIGRRRVRTVICRERGAMKAVAKTSMTNKRPPHSRQQSHRDGIAAKDETESVFQQPAIFLLQPLRKIRAQIFARFSIEARSDASL